MKSSTKWTRAVIVSGSFRSGFSYQENIWAEVLSRQGWRVTVLCPERASQPSKAYDFQIIEVPSYGSKDRNLLFEKDVSAQIQALRPDCILWFGPPQIFGLSFVRQRQLSGIPTAIFMGQNSRMQAFDWRQDGIGLKGWLKANAYRYIRGPAIRQAIARANLVVANTAETPTILGLYAPTASFSDKLMTAPLGYDPGTFTYKPSIRKQARADIGLSDDTLTFLLSSRFVPEKKASIRLIWSAFERFAQSNGGANLIVAGLSENSVSDAFRESVERSKLNSQVQLYPFLDRRALGRLFHAADVAVFARPSISCQEALGTGAFGLFSDDGSMDWLLQDRECGRTFKEGDVEALYSKMIEISEVAGALFEAEKRTERAAKASFLSYETIIDRVLSRLMRESG